MKRLVLLPAVLLVQLVNGQINSPYSRYALGDLYNARNVVEQSHGRIGHRLCPDLQSVNFINPALYPSLQTVTFDVGIENELRTIINPDRSERSHSNNIIFNYLALGMPIMKDKKRHDQMGPCVGDAPIYPH